MEIKPAQTEPKEVVLDLIQPPKESATEEEMDDYIDQARKLNRLISKRRYYERNKQRYREYYNQHKDDILKKSRARYAERTAKKKDEDSVPSSTDQPQEKYIVVKEAKLKDIVIKMMKEMKVQ